MSFTITDAAVKKAKETRRQSGHPEGWVLSIGLQSGGCSGFKYNIELMESPEDETSYRIVEKPGLRVFCDKKSYLFLIGIEIGFEETLMQSGFTFNAPKASRTCGCGESVAF